ncbi:hypothetical protein [Salmonella phage PLL1]|uniref:Uncharacterized protein n=3 Tax=Kuttervirus TaxID=2169536 RepID=A0A6G8RNC5_9CAUD|nr:hypothetical protein HYQ30_gp087 [Salmonella phage heyday]YP_009888404.1 hypothetical protein HYQ34_gp082 [Salmonella phage dinky]YP_009890056.1 hypothetical protein HYP87_gp175 [Salmonella phage SE14]UMO77590.1 hypothetical protein [Salmonella phage PLL1]WES09806.1 hypothetical protein [Salmonella phage SWJM-01]QEI23483.1 hypothetical protein [Salmonella phage SE14]QIO02235.1 hypothetical protein heyday_87 [Salmonella phage heyday]QIO02886.1 hypothetical protein dinky_82 [Salmonella phag
MAIPSFLNFLDESKQLDEAFNSAPYELTMGKKNAGDVFFTFIDEDEKEYRIQFYTPQGLGKNVRQVFIGQKRGSTYPDMIARFKNPMRVIASMIEATKQFLVTPLGKTIDGFAVNFSKKALDRGMTLIPKIIRQSGLKQKLNVMDLTYAPVPDRGYVWLVKKGKDPAQVFDGPKMQGITWDDPDKVGDVPVQNNTPDVGTGSSTEIEVNRQWYNSSDTSLELKNGRDPIRGNYVQLVSGSREVAKFFGYDFDKYPDGAEVAWSMKRGFTNQDLVGAVMTKQNKGIYDQYVFKKGGQIVLTVDVDTDNKAALATPADSNSNIVVGVDFRSEMENLSISVSGNNISVMDGRKPVVSFTDPKAAKIISGMKHPSAAITNFMQKTNPGQYTGEIKTNTTSTRSGMKYEFIALDFAGKQLFNLNVEDVISANNTADSNTTVGANSIQQLIDSGFVARVLGIIDTNIDQKASYLPGESIKKIGQARYQTKGGLVIIVSFDSVDGKNLKYSVFSEIESQPGVISGDARRVANEIMETVTYVAEHQYRGEWEINAVPMSAPYPIKAIRHSQGWGYVETANWTLKVSDALLNRVKPGKTALLELNKEPLRGKHLLEIIPEKGDKTLMLKDRSGAIYGSIDLNAQGANLVNSGTLKIPRNAMVFGETVNGMSITWSGINFPKGGKYDGAVMTTNVTYYYDKGKVAITPMVSNKGRTLNNPKTYELPLTKEFVQETLDSWSETMQMVARNMQTLTSENYNPMQVFLDDIHVGDNGEVLWRGHNMGDRRATETMLNILGKETDRLEKEQSSTAKKTGVDLATYAGSIRDNAPKGRDLDWQIYASRDGQTLNVDWDITFRRNTTEGAYREFKDQINRANQYLQTVYNDAKSKGYNPTEPNLMTLARAQQSDEWAASNGESAYSEYEQSLGGNLQIKI